MVEEVLVTARANAKIDPMLSIWNWEVPAYLFLGGMTAGIMFFASTVILMSKDAEYPFAAKKSVLWAPIILSLGMGALFLDLEHKLYVWRFYTTFEPSSPMSWGSWILFFVYPVSILLLLCNIREAYPRLAFLIDGYSVGKLLIDYSCRYRLVIAKWGMVLAVFLGIYTGILLSGFSARPFWNTGFLGPLFLISGLSSAAALIILGAQTSSERHLFTRVDIGLITVELILIALLLTNLGTGSAVQLQALDLVMHGPYTIPFWLYFVIPGLLVPAVLEYWELVGRRKAWMLISPFMVLYGGYMLRHLTVEVGQTSRWVDYATQFDPALLDLLKSTPIP